MSRQLEYIEIYESALNDIINIRDRMKEVNPGLTDKELDRIENDIRYYKGIAEDALEAGLAISKTEEVTPARHLWTVYIPEFDNYGRMFSKAHTDTWINQAIAVSSGVTVYKSLVGKYVSSTYGLMNDQVIAVVLMATTDEVRELATTAKSHFEQESIMYYLTSSDVQFI